MARETDLINIQRQLDELRSGLKFQQRLESGARFVPLTTPLTSTSWDGDSYSTTSKTKIDLSAVFGVPAGVKAVDVFISARDSGSLTGQALVALSPDNIADSYPVGLKLSNITNDRRMPGGGVVPCDENGDIYYQLAATGTKTLDVWIEIWGYWI